MGRRTVRFRCHHCLHCCTDVVALPTPIDVIRLVEATGRPPHEFVEFLGPDDLSDVDDSDPTWLKIGDARYIMALRRDTKKGCVFLDRKRAKCTVYDARPILCRLFPFKLQETRDGAFRGFALHQDVGCPRHQDGVVPTEPLYALYREDCIHQDDYESLVRVFNRRARPDTRPEEFLALFYEEVRGT